MQSARSLVILVAMALPQARLVKQGLQHYAPPPPVRTNQWKTNLRDAAAVAIGLWPLTAIVLFMVTMLFAAAHWSSP